jgi:hypothetical protein
MLPGTACVTKLAHYDGQGSNGSGPAQPIDYGRDVGNQGQPGRDACATKGGPPKRPPLIPLLRQAVFHLQLLIDGVDLLPVAHLRVGIHQDLADAVADAL